MTENELTAALRVKFPPPEYALLHQVRNGTGWSRKTVRTADVLVMGLYPSRGLHLSGIEIKVARHDWVRELKNPDKAEAIAGFCDFWWVAVSDPTIVRDGELPENWGLLAPWKNGLRTVKAPAALAAKPVDRPFLAASLRKAAESSVPHVDIEDRLKAQYAKGREAGRDERHWEKKAHAELLETVREFQEASGVKITNWEGGKRIGEAVKLVLSLDMKAKERLRELLRGAESIAATVRTVLDATSDDVLR